MGGSCSMHEVQEKFVKSLVRKPECKGLLWGPRSRWKDNITMDLIRTGRGCGLG
jgi:hypothetical protein